VDAVYASVPLAIELDGRAYHARGREMKRDRHRDADLQILGYRVLRLVWEDLYDDQAAETIARLTKLLRQRGARWSMASDLAPRWPRERPYGSIRGDA